MTRSGGTTRSRAQITADLVVFLCIEFPLKTTRLFVQRKSFRCLLWGSWGQVEACNTKSPLEPQHLGGV